MAALPPDYDSDPERWRSLDRSWSVAGDTHEVVADRIVSEGLSSVLDIGCGQGRLRELLPSSVHWFGVDASPTQLSDCPFRPLVAGDAGRLPFADGAFASVTALWMLYHLADPVAAITESRRVLSPGGLFAACNGARTSDPELCDGYPPTTFDAEEAPDIVGSVFGNDTLEVERLGRAARPLARPRRGRAISPQPPPAVRGRSPRESSRLTHQTRVPRLRA